MMGEWLISVHKNRIARRISEPLAGKAVAGGGEKRRERGECRKRELNLVRLNLLRPLPDWTQFLHGPWKSFIRRRTVTFANGLPRNSFVQSRSSSYNSSVSFYHRPSPPPFSSTVTRYILSSASFFLPPAQADLISSTPSVAYNFPRVGEENRYSLALEKPSSLYVF